MDFTIEINGNDVPAKANVWTLVVYEMEFSRNGQGADMLQDFFGKGHKGDDETEVVFDFTRTNWTAAAKAAWACIKSADDHTPPFLVWSKDVGDIPLFKVSSSLSNAFVESFFRLGAGVAGQQPEVKEENGAAS